MTHTPPSDAVEREFLLTMYGVLERAQRITPKPEWAELIEQLRPLRDRLVHMNGSPEQLEAASIHMRHHLQQVAATSLGSPEAQQIIQRADPNATAQILVSSGGPAVAAKAYDELVELPRGRGMLAGDVADRIGPGLRFACGVTSHDPPAVVRHKVAARLIELCDRLPTDLRISVLSALALHPQADHQFMQDRMAWAARKINREHPRAAVRRMKVGFQILSEQLDDLQGELKHRSGWYTSSLRAQLRMDVDPPQLVEERVIVATEDNLTELEIRLSAPGNGLPAATVLYGGEITRTERVTPSHSKFAVRLPSPLRAGEKHEYGVRFTASTLALMSPFYVLTPLRPCERFTVRVRFGANVPNRITRLDGVPPRAIDDFEPQDSSLTPDQFGVVALEFSQLQQGLSYGIRWSMEGRPTVTESH